MADKIRVIPISEFPRRKGSRPTGDLAKDIYAAISQLGSGQSLEVECGCGDVRHCSLRCAVLCWTRRRGISIQTVHDEGHLYIRLRSNKL